MSEAAVKIDRFPALAEMGIVRFHEISHYSLRQDGPDKDVLRIIYKRAKGSLLPFSRKYKFGRAAKTVITDGGTARVAHTYEISPFLLKALAELDTLVAENKHDTAKVSNTELSADLLVEIDQLEDIIRRTGAQTQEIAEKLATIRKHVEAI